MVQLPVQLAVPPLVTSCGLPLSLSSTKNESTVGGWSLQLCTSSEADVFTEVLDPVCPGGKKISTENLFGAELPVGVCLAIAGVQLVASSPETLSSVTDAEVVVEGLYQAGKISVLGLGSTEPRPTWLVITKAGRCWISLGSFQLTGVVCRLSSAKVIMPLASGVVRFSI